MTDLRERVEKDAEGRPYQCGAFVSDDSRWMCLLESDHDGNHEWQLRVTDAEPVAECRIYEYDGAFKCHTHNRLWGAVVYPDEPCKTVEPKVGGGWHTPPIATEPDDGCPHHPETGYECIPCEHERLARAEPEGEDNPFTEHEKMNPGGEDCDQDMSAHTEAMLMSGQWWTTEQVEDAAYAVTMNSGHTLSVKEAFYATLTRLPIMEPPRPPEPDGERHGGSSTLWWCERCAPDDAIAIPGCACRERDSLYYRTTVLPTDTGETDE